jgi:hypothetical protein
MNTQFFAAEMEREGTYLLKRAGTLLAVATSLRALPGGNAPTAEMRNHLAGLGFAVVSRDALVVAEACMDAIDEHPEGVDGAHAFNAAHAAVREALTFVHKGPSS